MLPERNSFEQILEIGAASTQNNLVCLETLALCGQRDIHKILLLQDSLEGGRQRNLIIIPFQTKLLPHLGIDHVLVINSRYFITFII